MGREGKGISSLRLSTKSCFVRLQRVEMRMKGQICEFVHTLKGPSSQVFRNAERYCWKGLYLLSHEGCVLQICEDNHDPAFSNMTFQENIICLDGPVTTMFSSHFL
jgi:hypothetical protein